jgi:hypothetical protein
VSAFHATTVTILRHVLAEQEHDLKLFQGRLERATAGASESALASFRRQITELTAVAADFTELLRLIEQHDADVAEEDRQIAESYRVEAQRCELHLTGPGEAELRELAVRCSHSAVTS